MFTDAPGYVSDALTGHHGPVAPAEAPGNWTAGGVLFGLLSAALAVAIAAAALYGPGVARLRRAGGAFRPAVQALRALHSGLVTDYVAWLVTGVAVFAAVVGLPLA
jgi:multicomponent Na+:H+ antiporter subunit D